MAIHSKDKRPLLMQMFWWMRFFLIDMMNECLNTRHRNPKLIQTQVITTCSLLWDKRLQCTYWAWRACVCVCMHTYNIYRDQNSRSATQACPETEANTYIQRHFPSAQLHLWNKTSADIELTTERQNGKVQQPCDHSLFILGYIWQPL